MNHKFTLLEIIVYATIMLACLLGFVALMVTPDNNSAEGLYSVCTMDSSGKFFMCEEYACPAYNNNFSPFSGAYSGQCSYLDRTKIAGIEPD